MPSLPGPRRGRRHCQLRAPLDASTSATRFFIIRALPEATQCSVAESGQQAQLPFTLEPRAGSTRSQPLMPCALYFSPENCGSCEQWMIKIAPMFPFYRNI